MSGSRSCCVIARVALVQESMETPALDEIDDA